MIHLLRPVLILIIFLPTQLHSSEAQQILYHEVFGEWVTACAKDRFKDNMKFCFAHSITENGHVGVDYSLINEMMFRYGKLGEPELKIDLGLKDFLNLTKLGRSC